MVATNLYSQYDGAIEKLRRFLMLLIEHHGSDLHIKSNSQVRARIHGEIFRLNDEIVPRETVMDIAKGVLRSRFDEFVHNKEIDLTYVLNESYQFRVNFFFQKDGVSGVFRVIPLRIMTIEELKLPAVVDRFADLERGLVLVTGITGSGKSTTLAAIIDAINARRNKHIITIEDPLEFVHQDRRSIINQRSVGQDTLSFANALRSSLREDPDIILVGEMRDLETIQIALHAAETGHLVFSTLHTLDAKETISRIIGMFSYEEQNWIRKTLSSVLQGVISQRLAKTKDGKRRAAVEILVRTARISQLIADNREEEINGAIEEGHKLYGSQTFNQAVYELYEEGVISEEEALRHATTPDDVALKIRGIGAGTTVIRSGNDLLDIESKASIKLKM